MTRRRAMAILLALMPPAALGCGRKGPPLPPRPLIPGAVGAVRAEPRANAVLLSWSAPARNQDGSPLRDLLEFRISRSPGPGPEGPAGFAFLATVPARAPEQTDGRYTYLDDGAGAGLRPGVRYAYRVQPVNRRGALGPVAETAVTLTPP